MTKEVESKKEMAIHKLFNTKLLMISSALFMGLIGVSVTFLPQEIMQFYSIPPTEMTIILIKIAGALYLGFAILNWMARGNIIGGIYSRPVALGNFFHFVLIGIMLLKQLITNQPATTIIGGAIAYVLFAISFGYILFKGGKSCG